MKNVIHKVFYKQKIFYRYFRKKGVKRFFLENILESNGSNENKAKSIALGVFIGLTPLWGFQTVITLFLATFFRLNKSLAFLGSQITFPPLIPFFIYLSIRIGALFSDEKIDYEKTNFSIENTHIHLVKYLIGSFSLALSLSIIIGLLTYLILIYTTKNKLTN